MPPVTAEVFQQKVLEQRAEVEAQQQSKTKTMHCKLCNKTFSSENAYGNHMSSKRHKELEATKVKKEVNLITKGLAMESREDGSKNAESEIAESSLCDKVDDVQSDNDDDDDDEIEEDTLEVTDCLFCPHRSVSLEENMKHMTRSQMILQEDLKKKKEKEEAELHKKFRAQPVPATTFLPLYDEITRQNELRRYHVRELSKAILKSTERPFKFVQREDEKRQIRRTKSLGNLADFESKLAEKKEFKANPFPDRLFDLTLADKMAEKEEYRAIRMRMRSQEMLASSRLPPNMESRGQEYTLGHFRSKLNKEGNKNAFMTREHKFKPQINHDIPEFDALHRQFEKEMRNKKTEKEPTVVEPFNLRTARVSAAKKSRCSQSQEVPDSGRSSRDRSASRERPSSARPHTPHDTLPFG